MWPHQPVGRVLITLAIALVGSLALLIDAAVPAEGSLMAWHALSMLVLTGLAVWALWAPQLPQSVGRPLSGLLGLMLMGGLAVAAQRLPGRDAASVWTLLAATFAVASSLFLVGSRWARREIRW